MQYFGRIDRFVNENISYHMVNDLAFYNVLRVLSVEVIIIMITKIEVYDNIIHDHNKLCLLESNSEFCNVCRALTWETGSGSPAGFGIWVWSGAPSEVLRDIC